MSQDYPDADRAAVDDESPPSSRVPLSRQRIVDAAVEFIDANGLPGLTMRRLGERLHVEAMALYRYVPSKEELLDAVVESLVAQVRADDVVLDGPRDGWQDFLQRLAQVCAAWPLRPSQGVPAVASRPPRRRGCRPPLAASTWSRPSLPGCWTRGSPTRRREGYRAYTSFLLGHLLLEVAVHGADVGRSTCSTTRPGSPATSPLPDGVPAARAARRRTGPPSSSRRPSRPSWTV